jgi:predicted DNA-binding transcriptional regulator AlpA
MDEVAGLLGVSRRAAYARHRRGGIPGLVRNGPRENSLSFSRVVVTEWIADRSRDPHSESPFVRVPQCLLRDAVEFLASLSLVNARDSQKQELAEQLHVLAEQLRALDVG